MGPEEEFENPFDEVEEVDAEDIPEEWLGEEE